MPKLIPEKNNYLYAKIRSNGILVLPEAVFLFVWVVLLGRSPS